MSSQARLVIIFLGLALLIGLVLIGGLAAKGRAPDASIVGIVTGALGALASILAKTSEPKP